jgi:AsmA family
MFKIFKWMAIGLVLLIILAIVITVKSLDGILRSAVQTEATNSLNLPTTLGGVDLSLLGGKLSLSDLAIASPKGFSAAQMFTLGTAAVNVSYGQLRGNPIRIDAITLDKPKIVIEQSGGKLNLQALTSNSASSSTPPSTESKSSSTMKLIINKLTISNADVTLRPDIPGIPAEIPLTIPTIDLQNIGNADGAGNGAAIKEVVAQILQAVESKAGESGNLPPEVKALLSGNLSQIGDAVKEKAGNAIKDLKSGNTDAAKNALNGLLGGKKGD